MNVQDGGASTAASRARRIAFWAGPAVFAVSVVLALMGTGAPSLDPKAVVVLGTALWIATWWIAEAVPIGATSLLPLAIFPLAGVEGTKAVAKAYMNPIIVLLLAGFMAALAIERCGLHKRVALRVLLAIGTSPPRLVLGMMVACAAVSMWISNTATTLMMLPIAIALLVRAEEVLGRGDAGVRAFGAALCLGIAYAASIGGLGTPIGTPPNLIMLAVYRERFPDAPAVTFLTWMRYAVPVVVVTTGILWIYLVRVAHRVPKDLAFGSREVLEEERRALGPMDRDQLAVALVFLGMALFWVTREISLDRGRVAGWAPALGLGKLVDDGTVAVLGALVLFAWPSRVRPGERLLDWATASRIPWDVVLLFGGGVALADAFETTGLSASIAGVFGGLVSLPVPVLLAAVVLTAVFLSEVGSNTATATLLMPVMATFAAGTGLSPEGVMLPAVLATSFGFMLPVATAPNAIVYGTGRVSMGQMARAGFALDLGGAALLVFWGWLNL